MLTREKGYAICIENRGAEDLEVRKVYRVLPDKAAASTGYTRVIPSSCRRRPSVRGPEYAPLPGGGLRRTSRFSGPELALLAPAAERRRWTDEACPGTMMTHEVVAAGRGRS